MRPVRDGVSGPSPWVSRRIPLTGPQAWREWYAWSVARAKSYPTLCCQHFAFAFIGPSSWAGSQDITFAHQMQARASPANRVHSNATLAATFSSPSHWAPPRYLHNPPCSCPSLSAEPRFSPRRVAAASACFIGAIAWPRLVPARARGLRHARGLCHDAGHPGRGAADSRLRVPLAHSESRPSLCSAACLLCYDCSLSGACCCVLLPDSRSQRAVPTPESTLRALGGVCVCV